jgi:hypothetical protein
MNTALKSNVPSELFFAVCCIIFLFCYYVPYLFWGYAIAPAGDTINLTGPLFCEVSQQVRLSKFPLFDWETFETLHYHPHIVPYYPFFFLRHLDFCSPEKAVQSQDVLSVLHVAIFFCNLIVLGIAARLRLHVAVLFAFFASVSVNTVNIAVFPTIIAAAAWMPLAVAGLVWLLFQQDRLLGLLFLVVGTVMMLMAGPGTNMIAPLSFFGLTFGLIVIVRWIRDRHWDALVKTACVGGIAAIFIGLMSLSSTINLMLHLEELIRWTRTGAVIGRSGAADITEILAERASWGDLLELAVPSQRWLALGSFELGPIVLPLAMLGAWLGWNERPLRAFSIAAAACLVIGFVLPRPLLLLWSFVPGMGHTRHLSLLATPLSIAASMLAAYALSELWTRHSAPKTWKWMMGAMALVLVLMLAGRSQYVGMRMAMETYVLLLILAVTMVGAIWFGTRRGANMIWAAGVIAAVHGLLTHADPHAYFSPGEPPVMRAAGWQDLQSALDWVVKTDPEPGRLVFLPSITQASVGNQNPAISAQFRLLPTFQFQLNPRIYWKLGAENFALPDDVARYGELSGKYVLSKDEVVNPALEQVTQAGSIRVYRNNLARPWISVSCSQVADQLLTAMAGAAESGRLPKAPEALTPELSQLGAKRTDCDGNSTVGLRWDVQNDRVHWQTPAGRNRILIVNLPPYRAWKIKVGGKTVRIFALNDHQIAAAVPADLSGESVLSYRPYYYFWRLFLSAAAAVVFLLGCIHAWRLRDAKKAILDFLFR